MHLSEHWIKAKYDHEHKQSWHFAADWSKQTTKALVKEFERKNQNPEIDFLFNDNFACGFREKSMKRT